MRFGNAKKAISPLIATVLLVSFTFTLAAIVAGWGQNTVSGKLEETSLKSKQQVACSGGTIQYLDVGQPNPAMAGNQIKAQIIVNGVPLGNFTFLLVMKNLDTVYLSDSGGTSLAPGARNIGTITSEATTFAKDNITSVTITSNCTDAKTVPRPLG